MTFSFNVGGLTPQDSKSQGGGGTIVETLSPENCAGLCIWLDSEINSRKGVHDEAVNGMQNLIYSPYVGHESTTGCREALNGTPTFTDKACKLGGTMFVPSYKQTALTFEFVCNFTATTFDNISSRQLFMHSLSQGGYQIFATKNNWHYQLTNNSGSLVKYFGYPISLETNKTYHIAITDDFTTTGSTKFYIDGVEVVPIVNSDKTGGVCATKTINTGIMGICSTSTQSIFPVTQTGSGSFYGEYTNINTLRMWNRALSAEEIKQNYDNDKRRFD